MDPFPLAITCTSFVKNPCSVLIHINHCYRYVKQTVVIVSLYNYYKPLLLRFSFQLCCYTKSQLACGATSSSLLVQARDRIEDIAGSLIVNPPLAGVTEFYRSELVQVTYNFTYNGVTEQYTYTHYE